MHRRTLRLIHVVLIISLCAVAVNAQATSTGTGGVIPAAKLTAFFQNTAAEIIPSTIAATCPKDGSYALIGVYDPTIPAAVAVAGIGGSGTFTVNGTGLAGPCVAMGGFVAGASTTAASSRSGGLVYYQVNGPANTPFPTSEAQANQYFTAAFGASSLPSGQSLNKKNSSNTSYYMVISSTLSFTNPWTGKKYQQPVSYLKAVCKTGSTCIAVCAFGFGQLWNKVCKGK
ncbi:MAG: hypothetical protein HY815_10495 [Candidatus Riflebacteria bacterium]|nr:hypothetical protein [Candidatus Riflebacteria bacterium]